ncbi:glycosyltransferase family 2 protein [Flavobacteriaceae bacterium 14752]|uniref:glycosyltransferase family 2 protein n=1 Tax=Mesohalobacter salilacus TaxID=2491711 RepID=UPI000F643C24|nr:glycosyltransferase family 2 protein [Flavobacteriaceae bacterium 14752]
MVDISVIIINFNSSQYTIECVKSIISHTSASLNYEIIVVDNKSSNLDFDKLKGICAELNFESLYIYRNSVNAGFGGGNMFGYRQSKGKYLAFINNDVLLNNDCLRLLKVEYNNNAKIGICGPTTYTDGGKILPTLDFFASPLKYFFGRKFFKLTRPKLFHNRHQKLNKISFGDFVSGSFLFINREIFNSLGGFDENIFLYHEETDLCKRLKKLGLGAAIIPQAECFHHHGASTKKSIRIKTELKRSLLYIMRKHYGFLMYKIIHINMMFKYFFKSRFNSKYKFLFNHISKGMKLKQSTQVIDE